jgi:hypothetical protein
MIVFGVAYFYYLNHEKEMKEQEKAAIQQEAVDKYIQEHPTKVVYALAQDKKAGEVLSDTDFAATEINEELVPADAVLEPSFAVGKVMRSDMKQNTILTESLYYEEKDYPDDMRLLEYTVVNLPQKLDVNEFVDLRIMLPTGSDYIVLSKKRVIDLQRPTPENPKNIIWFHALEEEILRMTSAIVDASFVDGAILYAVPYVAPDVQDEAIQTYPPNIEVQNLIIQNPNILEKAITELEARNRKLFEENVNNCFESMGKNRVFTNDNQVLLPVPDDNAGNPGSGTSIEDNL